MPSAWLPPSELAAQRTAAAQTFPESCIVQRLAEVSDGQGGFTQAWTAVGTVDARMVAKSGNTRAVGGKDSVVGAYTLTVPVGTDIQETDRVVIGAVPYRVLFVDDLKAWQIAVRCDCDLEV